MSPETPLKPLMTRYYRKRVELFRLIDKIKLWPSRQGALHGIKTIELLGDVARLTTHCGKTFLASNSRNSRAARWLRNKWFKQAARPAGFPIGSLKSSPPPASGAIRAPCFGEATIAAIRCLRNDIEARSGDTYGYQAEPGLFVNASQARGQYESIAKCI